MAAMILRLQAIDLNQDGMSDVWQQVYRIPSTEADLDADGDGHSNAEEAVAGTNPHDPSDDLRVLDFQVLEGQVRLTWSSKEGRDYWIEQSTDLIDWQYVWSASGSIGQTTELVPHEPDGSGKCFFRVRVDVWADFDSDGDQLLDWEETLLGTQPDQRDSDADGMDDGFEFRFGLNPGLPLDAGLDLDEDGLSNLIEFQLNLDPWMADSDGDGIGDGEADADRDGLSNRVEVTQSFTWPAIWDSDWDGMPDGWEFSEGLDALSAGDADGADGDPDGDGLKNFEEWLNGTHPKQADTDGDGKNDGDEVAQGGNPTDASDGGVGPAADQLVEVPFSVGDSSGSHSEQWKLIVKGLGPNDSRTMQVASQDFGVVTSKTLKLRKWNRYEVTVEHLATDPDYLAEYRNGPDYDWEARVAGWPESTTEEASEWSTGTNQFSVAGRYWVVDNREVVFTAEKQGDERNLVAGKKAYLVPISIRDNPDGLGEDSDTGVDHVSVEAAPDSKGYQEKFWIMAPAGGSLAVNGVSYPLNDHMHFKIPLIPEDTLEVNCSNASAEPATTVLSEQNPGPVVSWTGSGDSKDWTPEFRLGKSKELVDLPIGVKVMKKREFKVSVFPVRLTANSPAIVLPDKAKLMKELHLVFGYQLNAWAMEPEYKPEQVFNYDPDGDGVLSYPSPVHDSLVSMCDDPGASLIVILIGGVRYIAENVESAGAAPRDVRPVVVDTTNRRDLTVPTLYPVPESNLLDTFCHEFGHRIFGKGHPDQDCDISLGGYMASRRLMASGGVRGYSARLLVKGEWDKAEAWLKLEEDNERIAR